MRSRMLLPIIALLAFASAVMAQTRAHDATPQVGFYLRDGDRVVFYGDSITDQRLYTTFVESYVITRFPHLKVSFVHSGWGGDRVTGGGGGPIDIRLRRDVIAYQPTVMTIMLGMNDASYRAYDAAIFNTYAAGYQRILETVKGAVPGIRVTLIQPSPFDDITRAPQFEGGYNAVLVRYGQFVKEVGQREGLLVADLNTPLLAALEKAKAADPLTAQKIVPDRVHPAASGHLLMAEALLKAWSAPATVSLVEIDAARKRVARAENTHVSGLEVESGLEWTQADDALPMPINMNDAVLALALRSSDFVQALDQELLKVSGLTAERYALKIDGQQVGDFTKQQLQEGVNLALLPTPMEKQAMAVHDLTLKHNNLHFARWRQVQVPFQDESLPHVAAVLDDLDKLEAEVVERQRAIAQPAPHDYELQPQ